MAWSMENRKFVASSQIIRKKKSNSGFCRAGVYSLRCRHSCYLGELKTNA